MERTVLLRASLCACLLTVAALTAAPTQAASSDPFFSIVSAGDPDGGRALVSFSADIAFYDANNNQHPDAAKPSEPVYLDLDTSHTVSYGDVRITPFAGMPAGSTVDVPDRDVGRPLLASGWFGQTDGKWFIDLDNSHTVTATDIDLARFARVQTGDAMLVHALTAQDSEGQPRGTLWWLDADHSGHYPVGAPLYMGVGTAPTGSLTILSGDLRLHPTGFAAEPVASAAAGQTVTVTVTPTAGANAAPAAGAGETNQATNAVPSGSTPAAGGGFGPLELVIALLAIVNLVGLVMVARRLPKGPPKNPFN